MESNQALELWLLRHAEAAPRSSSGRDVDRPLSERGRADCQALNRWLGSLQRTLPERILVSPALRTHQTAEQVLAGLSVTEVIESPAIWEATAGDLLNLSQQQFQSGHPRLMLIGHNPGLEHFCRTFSGQIHPMPPGCLLAFEIATPMRPDPTRCRLLELWRPGG